MTQPGVLCVGRVYCDLVFSGLAHAPLPGEEVYAEKLYLHTGGGAAITAHTLAKLGRAVELCASLPAAPFTSLVQSDLESTVGLQYCVECTQASPQITVVLTGESDRSFVTHRAQQALPENYIDLLRQCAANGDVTHVHIGELATLIDCPELIEIAREANWTVSLDCAWDVTAIRSQRAKSLIEKVDVFMPNEVEIGELANAGVNEYTSALTVVKRGETGAMGYSRGQPGVCIDMPATKQECVDATGAGDAFNAGFIDAWLQHKPLDECIGAGNRCGEKAVGHFGGIAKQSRRKT